MYGLKKLLCGCCENDTTTMGQLEKCIYCKSFSHNKNGNALCLFHSLFIIVNISNDGFSLSRTRIKQSNVSQKVIRKVVNDTDMLVVLKLPLHTIKK